MTEIKITESELEIIKSIADRFNIRDLQVALWFNDHRYITEVGVDQFYEYDDDGGSIFRFEIRGFRLSEKHNREFLNYLLDVLGSEDNDLSYVIYPYIIRTFSDVFRLSYDNREAITEQSNTVKYSPKEREDFYLKLIEEVLEEKGCWPIVYEHDQVSNTLMHNLKMFIKHRDDRDTKTDYEILYRSCDYNVKDIISLLKEHMQLIGVS